MPSSASVIELEELPPPSQFEEEPLEEDIDPEEDVVELSPDDAAFIHDMILKILVFTEDFCDVTLFPYQREVAYRIVESVLIGDGEEISVLQARQSGKSEVLANVIVGLMVLLPRLAKAYPDMLGKFAKGLMVGIFAPTDNQAETVWGRVHDKLTSAKAKQYYEDPEIDDQTQRSGGKTKTVTLKNSGSFCRMHTANPKAKIESKSYHFVLVDEAQDVDTTMITKSISPMCAFYNGTKVFTGTPNRVKSYFQGACAYNKRRASRGGRRNHYEYNYKFVCRYNADYKKYIAKEKARLREDSDEFQMSYNCKWLLDQGMFVTEDVLGEMCDPRMGIVGSWWRDPVVVGIDPARTHDSTVVTVVWVDWNHADPFGYREHRILNWKEITAKDWERQYAEIAAFLANYNVLRIGVDAQGMGGPVAERIQLLFPDVDVRALTSDNKNQSERWKHFKALIERRAFVFPGDRAARRTTKWKRFVQQMTDLETIFQGNYMLAAAPDARGAFDDYADSAALACFMTTEELVQEVESADNFFYSRR